ncbi:MAG TPA: N-acetyl-gamma-glutamyl-phosphate reductase [Woeseiaceae bacterium]|nr:N-acetyl-gamma-glutamyl-phosphate reductase [Woeseiaceae bacterium]
MRIPVVVLGATGYVGGELLRLLHTHPDFALAAAVSESRAGERIAKVFPQLAGAYDVTPFTAPREWPQQLDRGAKLALFSAAPHGASASLVAAALDDAASRDLDLHVVDSSADFRYGDAGAYRNVYGAEHGAPQLLANFHCAVPEHVTGVPSVHIGHPGCFATAVLLAAVPLVHAALPAGELFVSGVTGSTGSGRSPQEGTHHPERHSNFYAYKPLGHRHVPEIEALIAHACGARAAINFIPHSGPFARGIHVTLQAKLKSASAADDIRQLYSTFYRNAEFVRIVGGMPRLKDVVASNYCHIGVATRDNTVVVMSVIDNLVKGAAGGAVQWMNRLWSLPESSGLLAAAPSWT